MKVDWILLLRIDAVTELFNVESFMNYTAVLDVKYFTSASCYELRAMSKMS